MSDSGRTNLTIYNDFYSGAKVPAKVVFGIDGQFITYAPEVDKCSGVDGSLVEDNCLHITTSPIVRVAQGDSSLLTVTFGDSLSATVQQGFFDPRSDHQGQDVALINLTCKEYYQEP